MNSPDVGTEPSASEKEMDKKEECNSPSEESSPIKDIIFEIPGLESTQQTGDSIDLWKGATTSNIEVDDLDSITEAFKTAISEELSGKSETLNEVHISETLSLRNIFDEDSTSKFGELESKISDILFNISKEEEEEASNEIKEGNVEVDVTSDMEDSSEHTSQVGDKNLEDSSEQASQIADKNIEDTEDISMDVDNDGDALGLLAEGEGRERHSSDPEDEEDEEDGDPDLEMEEEHLESDIENDAIADDGAESNDEDYQPRSEDEEDDDIEDEDEDDLGHKRVRNRKKIPTDFKAQYDIEPIESLSSFQSDNETSDVMDASEMTQCHTDAENSLSDLTKVNEPTLAISSVTSLMLNFQNEDENVADLAEKSTLLTSLTDNLVESEKDSNISEADDEADNVETLPKISDEEVDTSKCSADLENLENVVTENIITDIPSSDDKEVISSESEGTDSTAPTLNDLSTCVPKETTPVVEAMEVDDVKSTTPEVVEKDAETEKIDIIEKTNNSIQEKDALAPTESDATPVPASKCDATAKDTKEPVTKESTEIKEKIQPNKVASEKEEKQKTATEVYSLDSDDEISTMKTKDTTVLGKNDKSSVCGKTNKLTPKKSLEKRVKSGETCVNPTCLEFENLAPCPLFIPSIFRARDVPNVPRSCKRCLKEGIFLMEKLSSRLKAGFCLLDIDVIHTQDLVEISDSDSDDESKGTGRLIKGGWRKKSLPKPSLGELLDEEEKAIVEDVLPDLINDVWEKFDSEKQIKLCEDNLLFKMDSLEVECNNLKKMISTEQKFIDSLRKKLYETFRHPTECESEIIINDENIRMALNTVTPERRSSRLVKKQTFGKPMEGLPIEKEENIVTYTADSVSVADPGNLPDLEKLPPRGRLPDYTLNVGDTVYAVRQSIFGAWCLGRIVRIMPRGTKLANGNLSQFSLVSVHFIQGDREELVGKQVTGRQVAYILPSPVIYPVGTRVIALFQNKQQFKEAYYSGVIAEVPVKANRFRYLVFFDDGYSRYVYHKFILLVSQRSSHAWEDVHPDSRDFIRKYLQGFPNQPMVRVQPGQSIKTEYRGKFILANIVSVDASLVLIKFFVHIGVPQNHEEWIYRGSTRLEPLYLELQAADRKSQGRYRASYATTNLNKSKHFPYVEYSRPEQKIDDSDAPAEFQPSATPLQSSLKSREELRDQGLGNRAVAKKSTALFKDDAFKAKQDAINQQQQYLDQVKSKVVYYSPKVTIRPKKLVPHQCSPDCLNKDAIALRELRTYNPLTRPLVSGWQRLLMKFRGKRTIMYYAPCGRRLRTPRELHLYLRLTRSQMSVDLFDFDHGVHCLAEYVPPKCFVSKKDLSHGVEAVPIPCVNYFDHTLPEFSAYSTRRIPTRGVNLNLDEEFLCGCDCTDDCQDKNKCQCWQMTLEGASTIGCPLNRVGYQYKRLLDPVPTGIYECNSRCKCAATCLNRVVQHPLQLKLQVFKTMERGWGIRALNDVSKGTFICIYAGNLLTDAVANVDGVTEGDEYLAELDYIEVVEKHKENYESDVPDDDYDEDSGEASDGEKNFDPFKESRKTGAHGESDEEFRPPIKISEGTEIATRQLRRKKRSERNKDKEEEIKEKAKEEIKEVVSTKKDVSSSNRNERSSSLDEDGVAPVVDEFITISDDEEKREPSRFAAPDDLNDDDNTPKHRSVRSFFGKDEACYIMDAKVQGNLGRYLNHSCCPNVFVQNVFVDTHDLRFPWVAFFTLNHVRAGTELTWNYNYDIGSVPGKVIFCRCGAPNCRGRLL